MTELLKSHAVLGLADMILTLVLLKGTVLVAVAALVLGVARRTSGAARASLWTLSFGALLVLPLAWRLVPWWQAGVVTFPRSLFRGAAEPAGYAAPGGVAAELASAPFASYIAIVWMAGALLLLSRFAAQRIGVELVARAGRPVRDPRCVALARRIAGELEIARPVRLVYTGLLDTPATFGLRRPVVLLPAAARAWDHERLSAVLYHELAHVQRRDYAALLLVELVRALYWPNPFVSLAARRARECQDRACDDTALRSGVAAAAYARHLLEVARTLGVRRAPAAALPLVRRSGLAARVLAVLDPASDRGAVGARRLGRWAVLALLLCAALGSADLWHCAAEAAEARAAAAAGTST